MNKRELQEILNQIQSPPKKYLGQHFLLNEEILNQIIATAKLKKHDIVVEIGAGMGNLTEKLAMKVKKVIAVEKDINLIDYLQEKLKDKKNVKIIHADALKINLKNIKLKDNNYKVVANIPYYITSPLLKKFLTTKIRPILITLLIQKEVAQRIIAKPPYLNILALSVQFFGKPKIIKLVPKENFWPKPEVDSAILKIEMKSKKPDINLEKNFFKLVKAGFAKKRKTLVNSLNLTLKIPKEDILKLLKQNKINPLTRAQEISFPKWINLATKAKQSKL